MIAIQLVYVGLPVQLAPNTVFLIWYRLEW